MKNSYDSSFFIMFILSLFLTACNSGGKKEGANVKYFRHVMFTETPMINLKERILLQPRRLLR